MICAEGVRGQDVSGSDDGGSLVTNEGTHFSIIGVLSLPTYAGLLDGVEPSVYARVTEQLEWIEKNIIGLSCSKPGVFVPPLGYGYGKWKDVPKVPSEE